jgi:uridine kinase
MNKPLVIGITGGSGSGKSYFLQQLMGGFTSREVCVLSQDHYYHPLQAQPLDEKGIHNFDEPHSIDADLFVQHLERLIGGETVKKAAYTFNNPAVHASVLEIQPAPVIVVEGIFILYFERIVSLLDLKIFLDAREHTRLSRRIARDHRERGYGHEDVLYRYEKHVAPSYQKYIAPYKQEADIVIPNNNNFAKGLELLQCYIKNDLNVSNVRQ